jgi:hypothetical protein
VIVERDLHPEKQYLQILSTEQGIQMDRISKLGALNKSSYTPISSTETTKPETEINRRGNAQQEQYRGAQQARTPSCR